MKKPNEIISQIKNEYEKIGGPTKIEPPYYAREFKYSFDMDIHVGRILDLLTQLLDSSFKELNHVERAIETLSHTRNQEVKIIDSYHSRIRPNKPKIRETEFENAWEYAKGHIMSDIYFVLHYYENS